jgi:hypothetical protein
MVAPFGFYIPGNLMVPGKIPRDCQSTTKFLLLHLPHYVAL